MQASVTERVLRTLNVGLHVALPLLLLGLLLALPFLERSARYPWFLGVMALAVATAAATASVLGFRRVVREGRMSDALAATGFGALAATATFAAITTLTGAANTLAPHDTVGRLALAAGLVGAAWWRRSEAGRWGHRGAASPDARARALRAAVALVGIEAVLGLSALLAATGFGPSRSNDADGGLPLQPLLLADVVSTVLFFVAAAALLLQPPPSRIRVPAIVGALLLAVGTIVVMLARPGHVDVALGQLTIAAGCIAAAASLLAPGHDRERLIEGIRVLASRMDDGVFVFDERLVLLWLNDAGRELAGVGRARGPMTLPEVLGADAHPDRLPDDKGSLERRDPRRRQYVEIDAAPAGSVPLALAISEIQDERAGVLTLVVARDVAVQRQDLEDIERVSAEIAAALEERDELRRTLQRERGEQGRATARDPETGVTSEEAIRQRLRADVAQARRYPHPLAIALAEVRPSNDDVAAAPLREVATRLQLRLRVGDAVGRFGEQRFLLVLPHTEERGAHALADAIRARMSDRPITTESGEVRVEAAIGIAVLNAGSEVSPEALLARAGSRLEHDRLRAIGGDQAAGQQGTEPEESAPPEAAPDAAEGMPANPEDAAGS